MTKSNSPIFIRASICFPSLLSPPCHSCAPFTCSVLSSPTPPVHHLYLLSLPPFPLSATALLSLLLTHSPALSSLCSMSKLEGHYMDRLFFCSKNSVQLLPLLYFPFTFVTWARARTQTGLGFLESGVSLLIFSTWRHPCVWVWKQFGFIL